MSAPLTEFHKFPQLPSELRQEIWERVPRPERILALLPCAICWRYALNRGRQVMPASAGECNTAKHPDWKLRWVVNSPREAVFPPLQACRESRAVWRRHYFQPDRYHDGDRLRFDVPFISYETDIFAVVDEVRQCFEDGVKPFLGLDRERIERIAVAEHAWAVEEKMAEIQLQKLPQLKNITILTFGLDPRPGKFWWPSPQPSISGSSSGHEDWQEIMGLDIQLFDSTFITIPDNLINEHPFFIDERPRHPMFQPDPSMRQLTNYIKFFKAWIWHGYHWDEARQRNEPADFWWSFYEYLFEAPDDAVCPLTVRPEWCPGGHSRGEMYDWKAPFEVDVKLLAERKFAEEFERLGVLEFDEEGAYARFREYRTRRAERVLQG